jgi:uncharacterized protein (DUF58 family)
LIERPSSVGDGWPRFGVDIFRVLSTHHAINRKFTAEVQSANADTVTVNFLDRNNKPVSRVVFAVNNPDALISASGTQTRVSRLQRGTRVTFYIHHNRWGLFADPDSAPLTILSREDI